MAEGGHKDPLSVFIVLVVVRKGNSYLIVQETDGSWFLPAGRVDFGESFSSGALRETLEEARVNVRLSGVLSIQYHFYMNCHRVRVVFLAEPLDDNLPKSVPDKESLRAEWLSLEQLDTKNLRAPEVRTLVRSVADGAFAAGIDVISTTDSSYVCHERVLAPFLGKVVILVIRGEADHRCVLAVRPPGSKKRSFPQARLKLDGRPSFLLAAETIIPGVLYPTALFRMHHIPPASRSFAQELIFVFKGEVKCPEGLGNNCTWVSLSELLMEEFGEEQWLMDLIQATIDGSIIASPLSVLAEVR